MPNKSENALFKHLNIYLYVTSLWYETKGKYVIDS